MLAGYGVGESGVGSSFPSASSTGTSGEGLDDEAGGFSSSAAAVAIAGEEGGKDGDTVSSSPHLTQFLLLSGRGRSSCYRGYVLGLVAGV